MTSGDGLRFGIALCALAATAIPVVSARAQVTRAYGALDNGIVRGPAAIDRGLSVEATLLTEYGTNLIRLGDGVRPPPRARGRSDLRARPGLRLGYQQPIGRQTLFANAAAGYDFYRRNTYLNSERLDLDAGGRWRLGSRCNVLTGGRYGRRLTVPEETAEAVSTLQETTELYASGDCGVIVGIAPSFAVERGAVDNVDPGRRRNDQRRTSARIGLGYNGTAIGRFSLTGRWQKFDYPGRDESSEVKTLGLQYARAWGPRINLNLSLDYNDATSQFIDPRGERGNRDFAGLGFNAGIDYRPGARLSASLNAGRSVSASSSGESAYTVDSRIGAEATYRRGDRLSFGIDGSIVDRDFRGVTTPRDENGDELVDEDDNPLAPRDRDTVTRIGLSVDYRLLRFLDFGLVISRQFSNSQPDTYDYSNTGVLANARAKF